MKYLFGPVNSRRLGLSQGIDLLPSGLCNFNCIYCEVNRPKKLTLKRQEYFPTKDIIAEIGTIFSDKKRADALDVFTITASGEPTLHSGLGSIVTALKEKTKKTVTVLTNGGLLHLADVQRDLTDADIVVPSLDTARRKSFQKINRPAAGTDLKQIIRGIAEFRQRFTGQLWLEILFVEGVNDTAEDIVELKKAVSMIQPDKIQLNTVARPPIESFAKPLTQTKLHSFAEEFGDKAEIIAHFTKKDGESSKNVGQSEILELLRRRPGTEADICESLHGNPQEIKEILSQLAQEKKIFSTQHASQLYWTAGSKD